MKYQANPDCLFTVAEYNLLTLVAGDYPSRMVNALLAYRGVQRTPTSIDDVWKDIEYTIVEGANQWAGWSGLDTVEFDEWIRSEEAPFEVPLALDEAKTYEHGAQ